MLRPWLEADWRRPLADPMICRGFGRHGNHGRTADQLFPGTAAHGYSAPQSRWDSTAP
jgi:hypothetical protein